MRIFVLTRKLISIVGLDYSYSVYSDFIVSTANKNSPGPTPDCPSIYRPKRTSGVDSRPLADTSTLFFCGSCLSHICTDCKSLAHEGVSCAEYRDATDGSNAFAEYRAANNVKDCPRCKAPMQKTYGCNHMTCRCGAHFCWVCLADFGSEHACHDHLVAAHGGIGIDDILGDDALLGMRRGDIARLEVFMDDWAEAVNLGQGW